MNAFSKLIWAATILTLAGCDDGPADEGVADITPPLIKSVTALDFEHLKVSFDEEVDRGPAEDARNYLVIYTVILSGSDTLHVASAALHSNERTVWLTTSRSMTGPAYQLQVVGVQDRSGNRIGTARLTEFTPAHVFDYTPPEIVRIDPNPGVSNAGVQQPIIIRFSETADIDTLEWTSGNGRVPFRRYAQGLDHYFWSLDPLALGTAHTFSIKGIVDIWGNPAPDETWTFTTTSSHDTTPPSLVSSSPRDLATSIPTDASITLAFSERIDPLSAAFDVNPGVGLVLFSWSNNGKTVRLTPEHPLQPNTQYTASLTAGGGADMAGNLLATSISIRFSTGDAIGTGAIVGTITGDAESNYADDPTGAMVIAAHGASIYYGPLGLIGDDVVTSGDSYSIGHLPEGSYLITSYLDSNGDGFYSPSLGDAFGGYGIDVGNDDYLPDFVWVDDGARVDGIDFTLYDPSSVYGRIDYEGVFAGNQSSIYVGLFDATVSDPDSPPAIVGYARFPTPYWVIETRDGLLEGTYVARAYLDLNHNGAFDAATEPAGNLGGDPIRIENGSDALDLVIVLHDPTPAMREAKGIAWPRPVASALSPEQLAALLRDATIKR